MVFYAGVSHWSRYGDGEVRSEVAEQVAGRLPMRVRFGEFRKPRDICRLGFWILRVRS